MISKVVFEFSVAGGIFPRLTHDADARVRVIAVPRDKHPVPAFEQFIDGEWNKMPLGDVPPELLITLGALLAGGSRAGWRMVNGETLTILLGHVDGAPFTPDDRVDCVFTIDDAAALIGNLTKERDDARAALNNDRALIGDLIKERDDARAELAGINDALNEGYGAMQALLAISGDLNLFQEGWNTRTAGWIAQIRDACLHTIASMRSTIDAQARDHLSDLSLIAERIGIMPVELLADTRDLIIEKIGGQMEELGRRQRALNTIAFALGKREQATADQTRDVCLQVIDDLKADHRIHVEAVHILCDIRDALQKMGSPLPLPILGTAIGMKEVRDAILTAIGNSISDAKRNAEGALEAIVSALGIPRDGLASPWVDSARDRILDVVRGLLRDGGPVPMRLRCPACGVLHVDVGELATKRHHTHACQSCGCVWRPAVVDTVGVRFLPGFQDRPIEHQD